MKEIKYTPQGFSYVDVNLIDVISWGGLGICNGCNKGPFENMKLIFVLGDTYCEECFNEWLERAKHYNKEDIESDLKYQKAHHINWYNYHIASGVKDGGNEDVSK
ncbi:MAG: hypothetical protein ACI3T9_01160 [Romboutsia timonensis]